jgi:hypothetical protein
VIRFADASLDHEEELHEVAIDGLAAGLEDEDVGTSDRLPVPAVRLAVGEGLELDLPELDGALLRNHPRQVTVRAAGEDHQPLLRGQRDRVTRTHLWLLPLDVETRQRLLNRPAFHRVLPCSTAVPGRSRARPEVHPL